MGFGLSSAGRATRSATDPPAAATLPRPRTSRSPR